MLLLSEKQKKLLVEYLGCSSSLTPYIVSSSVILTYHGKTREGASELSSLGLFLVASIMAGIQNGG